MNKGDLFSGLALLTFAVYLIQQSWLLPYYYEHGPGPGFFPLWTALALLLLAVMLVAAALTRREKTRAGEREKGETRRALSTWVGLMIMIALVEFLGFFVSFAIYTFMLLLVLDRRPAAIAAAVAAGSAGGFYLLFVYAFSLRLPKGPWGF